MQVGGVGLGVLIGVSPGVSVTAMGVSGSGVSEICGTGLMVAVGTSVRIGSGVALSMKTAALSVGVILGL